MATPEEIKAIAGLYVAYFDRAPDPAGLEFWINQLDNGRDFATISQDFADSPEAQQIYPFLATPEVSGLDATNLVTSIYQNLFGRDPESQGLNFWVDVVNSGAVAVGDMVEAIMMGAQDAVVNGELVLDKTTVENRIECALEYSTATSNTPGFVFDTEAYAIARAVVDSVDATQASVDAAKLTLAEYIAGEGTQASSTFTLCEKVVEVSPEIIETFDVTETVIYWGFNPHGHGEEGVDNTAEPNTNNLTNEGPFDGGIPAEDFFTDFWPTIVASNFQELNGIDPDNDQFSTINFGNVRDITVNTGDGGTGTVSFQYSDGSADDIALGAEYFGLLRDVVFDEEGNSRFFEKEVAADVPVYLYTDGTTGLSATPAAPLGLANGGQPIGSIDAVLTVTTDAVTTTIPAILTPSANNGGTYEAGFTDQAGLDDLIVAGRLELLHGAFIDGGNGNNTLEIDAKGVFAQPKALNNIQTIAIENLPNIYTSSAPDLDNGQINVAGGNLYPNLGAGGAYDDDSIIDISRARDLEKLVITEGDFNNLGAGQDSDAGDLTVTGIRNGAEVTLDGGFTDGDVRLNFSGTSGDGIDLVLNNVFMTTQLEVAHNATKLNIESTGGGNHIENGDFSTEGSSISEIVITGDAHLFIEGDLDGTIENDTPITINASANTGGVDLNLFEGEKVTFIGSQADDRFAVNTAASNSTDQGPDYDDDEEVTIVNAAGDNYYDIATYRLDVTEADGDNNVEFQAVQADITATGGDNFLQGTAAEFSATLGDGDNRIDLVAIDSTNAAVFAAGPFAGLSDFDQTTDIVVGDGANQINVFATGITSSSVIDTAEINITAGDGGNVINVPALPLQDIAAVGNGGGSSQPGTALSDVVINTGSGDDEILVGGSNITVNSGGGDDEITLLGIDNDFVTEVNANKEFAPSNYGAVLDIDTGTGAATINLGAFADPIFGANGSIVASEGSSITGSDITLFVNTHADLRAASLDGITSIVLDDDAAGYTGQGFPSASTTNAGAAANSTADSASLTLLDTQVQALGESVFSTQGEFFGAQSVLTIVVTSDTTLADLIDLSAWNDSIKLCFVVEDGVTLTMTAEQLHDYVAPDGIYVTNTNGYDDNQVIITDAGNAFDAYNQQNGGFGGGTVAGTVDDKDVTVIYVPGGYERPEEDDSANIATWDSDVTPVVEDPALPQVTELTITGAADIEIQGPVLVAENADVDFSSLAGDFTDVTDGVPTLTIANLNGFTEGTDRDDWGSITGNGSASDPARVDFLVANLPDASTMGEAISIVGGPGIEDGGIRTSGVQQLILTGFHTQVFGANGQPLAGGGAPLSQSSTWDATIYVCDMTQGIETLGLQNNREAMVTYEQVNWGTEILMEGDGYANASDQEKSLGNPDYSEVGYVTANYFEAGANATVRVTNQGTELGLNEDAEDGFDPNGERKLVVKGIELNNADRLLLEVEDGDAIIEDVSGNDIERVIVTGPEDVEIRVATIADLPEGVLSGKNSGLDSTDLVAIDGSGVVGTFTLTLEGPADLSDVTLTGVDAICLDPGTAAVVTMTADQLVALGSMIEAKSGPVTLDVVDMGDQPLDLSALVSDDLAIGSVTFVDEAVTVDATTDFGGATSLIIPEDSEVTMTVAQFETADAAMDATPTVTDGDGTGNADDNKLILTDVPQGEALGATAVVEVDLAGVAVDVDVDIIFDNFTANAQFDVSGAGGETTTAVISGTTDLSAGDLGTVDCVVLQDGAVLTLSQDQVQDLLDAALLINAMAELSDVIKLAPGATATLNINEIDGTGTALDLNELVDDWAGGLDIGTLTIEDFDNGTNVSLPGWTTGGADEIVTPTANPNSPEFGTESTTLTLTMSQFLDLDGIGFISGDSVVNITELSNTMDGADDGTAPDNAGVETPGTDTVDIDTSGITARKGTVNLTEGGVAVTAAGEAVFLTDTSDLSGFEIVLTDGQIIGFATEAQAATVVTEAATTTANGNPTGVVWLFDTWSGTVIDTAGYDSNIDTLFVYDRFVDGQNEEAIWTTLAGSIVVQKFNDEIPAGLAVFNRINTFEPFTTAPNGITFDDPDDFQTIGILTLNLEGNVTIGDVTVAESAGTGAFDSIVINSTYDNENGAEDPNVIVQPNKVGDININAPLANGLDLNVLIDTSDGQPDVEYANGSTGGGQPADTDDGLAIEVGTIFLGTPGAGANSATVDLLGDHDITIDGLDYSDPALTQVNVLVDLFDFSNDLEIGTVNMGDLSTAMGLSGDPDLYLILNNFTATSTTDLDDALDFINAPAPEVDDSLGAQEVILATDGDVDLTEITLTGAATDDNFFDIDGVHGLAAGTITLTADQIVDIGFADGPDVGTAADNWVLGPGVAPNDITIDVFGLSNQLIDLDAIRDAGFNIGTITVVQPGADLDNGTTLGGADQIVIDINDGDGEVILEMSAEQYNQLADGTIVEDREAAADPITDIGTVIIDRLAEIEATATGEATIDVTNVATTGNNTFWITDTGEVPADIGAAINGLDNDTTFSAASVLGDFSVTLVDLNSDITIDDQLAGQTIRFSTEVQANGRDILVVGADSDAANGNSLTNAGVPEADKDEKDTNVVWLFDSIAAGSPGLDVSGYSGHIGRVWISDELVDSVGGDVDSLFTIGAPGTPDFTLDADIIKRIETADLSALLELNVPINQRVEITAFTQLAGAEFEIDDPLVSISTLRIDMGGATNINDLVLDNILGPVDPINTNFPGDDDFALLEINSLLANNPDHYLLPDAWEAGDALPSNDLYNANFENNVVGDISSGADRGVLHTVDINTFANDTTVTIPPATDEVDADFAPGREGAQFQAETIFFSDDGDTTAVGGDGGTPTATLNIDGDNDVILKSIDTSDADITGLVVNQLGAHTLTVTGGSPAFDGDSATDDTTTFLTLTGTADNVAQFASTVTFDDGGTAENEANVEYNVGSGNTAPFAGVSSGALETINVDGHLGTVSLGVISQVNSELFTLNANAATTGQILACIGEALDDGTLETPTLSATGVWTFNGFAGGGDAAFGGTNNLDIEIKAIDVAAGGTLDFNATDICISGDVDLSGAVLQIDGDSTIKVAAGATLTLTVEQVDDLQDAMVVIAGEGTVVVTGESSTDGETDTTFGEVIQTAVMDLSAVTMDAADTQVEINVLGANDLAGEALYDENGDRVAQTVIGTANNDAVTIDSGAGDTVTGSGDTVDVILRLGADDGSIGDPLNTPTDDPANIDAAEEVGDTITRGAGATDGVQLQIEVDAGYDQLNVITGGNGPTDEAADIVQVASGAEFYTTNVSRAFVADANTTNDGTMVIENVSILGGATADEIVDVSAAGGANGIAIIGAANSDGPHGNTQIGSAQDDTIVDGGADTVDTAADGNDNEEDTFTGGAGSDTFVFNVGTSTVADVTDAVEAEARDYADVIVAYTDAADDATDELAVSFRIGNSLSTTVNVNETTAPGVDFTDTNSIAAAIATVLNANPDVSAMVDPGNLDRVIAFGENGQQFNFNSIAENAVGMTAVAGGDFTFDDLTDAAGHANDAADDNDDDLGQVSSTLTGTIDPGEVYEATVTRGNGTALTVAYTALGGDDADAVMDALAGLLNAGSGGAADFVAGSFATPGGVVPAPVTGELVIMDGTADDGGVTLSVSGVSTITGLSSSSLLDGSETTLDEADADVITDFTDSDDFIDFDGLAAGDGSNYDEDPAAADFATALGNANGAMGGGVIYYLTSTAADGGLLFYDANGDGAADGVISLPGVDATNFDDSNIM